MVVHFERYISESLFFFVLFCSDLMCFLRSRSLEISLELLLLLLLLLRMWSCCSLQMTYPPLNAPIGLRTGRVPVGVSCLWAVELKDRVGDDDDDHDDGDAVAAAAGVVRNVVFGDFVVAGVRLGRDWRLRRGWKR